MAPAIFYWLRSSVSDFFVNYSTVKEVEIRNTYIGILHRIIQLSIVCYVTIKIIWTEKGYQEFQDAYGSSVLKLKGISQVSTDSLNISHDHQQVLVWDAVEFTMPPIEHNAFFIATRKTVTNDQKQGTCPSALHNKLFCNSTHNPCNKGKPTPNAFGILTGKCVPSKENAKQNVCEINAWCPEELINSVDYQININDLQNFTVFIKTMVSFSKFNIKLRTVKLDTRFSCRFDHVTNPRCPIFSMNYILQKIKQQAPKTNMTALYSQGGLIEIEQSWKCNFDHWNEREQCFPTYTFNLLQSGDDKTSPGINYRFANKHYINGTEYRTLTKIYGLRFILRVSGTGARFNIVHLFIAIGSSIGYMIVADIFCEFIFMRFHKKRDTIRQSKVKVCELRRDKYNGSNKESSYNRRFSSPAIATTGISPRMKFRIAEV